MTRRSIFAMIAAVFGRKLQPESLSREKLAAIFQVSYAEVAQWPKVGFVDMERLRLDYYDHTFGAVDQALGI